MRDSALKHRVPELAPEVVLGVGEELMRDSALKLTPALTNSRTCSTESEKSSCATAL